MIQLLKRLGLAAVLLISFFANVDEAQACTAQGCVLAGPRLAQLNTDQGVLLGPVLGGLLGTSLNLDVLDWQRIAGGEVDVLKMLNLLSANADISTPAQVLATKATLAQILTAAAGATTGQNSAAAALALNKLAVDANLPLPDIALGDLIKLSGTPSTTSINALDLVTGIIQVYNYRNVVTTPAPVGLDLTKAPLLGGLSALTIQAQVVEPPVYVCGGVGTQFHTAAIRLMVNLKLLPTTQKLSLNLLGLPLVDAEIALLPDLSIFVEVARANGTITALSAISGALSSMSAEATPGVADLYIGTMSSTLFLQRVRPVSYANDIAASTIAKVKIWLLIIPIELNVNIRAMAQASTTTGLMNFTAPFPKTATVSSSANAVTNLVTSLLQNLQVGIALTAGELTLDLTALLSLLLQTLGGLLSPILSPVVATVVDPLLDLLGLKIGQAQVTAYGVYNICSLTGSVYHDANHSALRESGEVGTGETLFAKLVAVGNPTVVYASAVVDPTHGGFTFPNVLAANYSVRIDTNDTKSDVTPTSPTGWLPLETPTLMRSVAITDTDIVGQTYGLYHGSKLTGRVFADTGVGNGVANNIMRDGTEPGIVGVSLVASNADGSTVHDRTTSGNEGDYTLWLPHAAHGATVRIVESNPVSHVSIGGLAGTTLGSYVRASDTVSFVSSSGSQYSDVNFADVPAMQWDTDGRQVILPGAVAFYTHAFTAGTAGQVTFAANGPATADWSRQLFLDANCNGSIESNELQIVAPVSVVAGQNVCVVAKVTAAQTAAYNDQHPITVDASFAYANVALTDLLTRSDLTLIGSADGAGLHLTKSVDKPAAKPGDVLSYTVTYANYSSSPLSQIKIYDSTPAYTVFKNAACGQLGAGLAACTLTVKPSEQSEGSLEWVLDGALLPGATGTVTMQVVVQ